MDAITVNHISFAYRENYVLKDVSFSVAKGEFVGLIGPNGGGKTTLLQLLMGFLKPFKGNLSVFGLEPRFARSQVGWVPQNFRYDPHFPITVLEVVMLGRLRNLPWYGKISKKDKMLSLAALEKVGMAHLSLQLFSELSGGQAQRVLLARALVSNPSLLLLDEATAGVDMEAQAEIYKILGTLKGALTILMVTHDLRAAVHHVEKIFCVQQTLHSLSKDEVCKHFALGLYHPPLQLKNTEEVT